jgi:hypothetical protein
MMATLIEIVFGVSSVLALLNVGRWVGAEFGTFERFALELLKKLK